MDLIGLDISAVALKQFAQRTPRFSDRLVHGDVSGLPEPATYPLVIGIRVFQQGGRSMSHAHMRTALTRLSQGGLFCLRVNAVGTDFSLDHEVSEQQPDGGFTIRYLDGPKHGLQVHFISVTELEDMVKSEFVPGLPPRFVQTWREPAELGQWSQWEAIWRRT